MSCDVPVSQFPYKQMALSFRLSTIHEFELQDFLLLNLRNLNKVKSVIRRIDLNVAQIGRDVGK
jgi:hypothetical protein